MTETITMTRPGISWYTAPGISQKSEAKKETLDECIARVFDIPEVYLNVKGRYMIFTQPKHLRRYILERILSDNTFAVNDVIRVKIWKSRPDDFYLIRNNKNSNCPETWSVRINVNGNIYIRSGFISREEAISDRNMKMKEFNMECFKYSLNKIAELTGCDHATVIHSLKTCRNLMDTDRTYREKCNHVIEKLNNNLLILPE